MRDRLILVCAALVSFGASLLSSFHFDDYAIFADPVLTSPSPWWEVWRPLQTRPLTYFTFWLNFQLNGKDPIGYHLINLGLHICAVLLLYGVLRRYLKNSTALLAAAIFAVHPMQAEAVNYVWARSTLLMTVLCLLSLGSWVEGRYWTATAWFALALLAKEECAAFPLFLLTVPAALAAKAIRAGRAPLAAMAVLSIAAALRVYYAVAHIPGAGAGAQATVSSRDYLLSQGPVIWRYLRLLILPWGFTIDPQISIPPLWLSLAAWAGIAGIIWVTRRSPAGPWLIGGLILLGPSSSVFPASDLAADRRMYLPMAAISVAAAILLTRIRRPAQVAIVCALAIVGITRTQVWSTEFSLWSEAVRRAPDKVRPKLQLARVSPPAEALNLLQQAQKLAPSDPAVASETGKTYLLLGRPQDALPEFGRALALTPRDAEAFNNRGVALQALGQTYLARRDFEHALELDPCLFDARQNLLVEGIRVPGNAGCRYTPDQVRQLANGR